MREVSRAHSGRRGERRDVPGLRSCLVCPSLCCVALSGLGEGDAGAGRGRREGGGGRRGEPPKVRSTSATEERLRTGSV